MKIIKTEKYIKKCKYGYINSNPTMTPLRENWDEIVDKIVFNMEQHQPTLQNFMAVVRYITAVEYNIKLTGAEATALMGEVANQMPELKSALEREHSGITGIPIASNPTDKEPKEEILPKEKISPEEQISTAFSEMTNKHLEQLTTQFVEEVNKDNRIKILEMKNLFSSHVSIVVQVGRIPFAVNIDAKPVYNDGKSFRFGDGYPDRFNTAKELLDHLLSGFES